MEAFQSILQPILILLGSAGVAAIGTAEDHIDSKMPPADTHKTINVVHDWSLSEIAKILDADKRVLANKIVGVTVLTPEHLVVDVSTTFDEWTKDRQFADRQSVELSCKSGEAWRIDSEASNNWPSEVVFKRPIRILHDVSLSEIARILNQDKQISADKIAGIFFASPGQLNVRLCTDYNDYLGGPNQHRGLVYDKKSGWLLTATGGLDLRITKVEREKPSEFDRTLRGHPDAVAKWIIHTELTNHAKQARLFPAVPGYAATVNGQIDDRVLGGGSHVRIKGKEHDFVWVPPMGKLIAKHEVFAIPGKEQGKFILSGHFAGTENVPEEWRCNNFSYEWKLEMTPVGNEFELSSTLVDRELSGTSQILGDDFGKLWRGEVKSEPVKLSVVKPESPNK